MMRIATIVAVVILTLDQVSKYWVVHMMGLDRRLAIDVWPPYLNFRMAWNQGVNFGLFAHDAEVMRWILIAVALVISAVVWVWAWRQEPGALMQISVGLLVGGALGNVIDRILYGAVADFINMSCCGINNPYAFNIADVAIFAGAFGLILLAGRHKTP